MIYTTGNDSHIFSSKALSKTGYWLGVCHGWFHLRGISWPVRSANRELKNDKFLPTVGFEPPDLPQSEVAKRCTIRWYIYRTFKCWPRFTWVCYLNLPAASGRCSKIICPVFLSYCIVMLFDLYDVCRQWRVNKM